MASKTQMVGQKALKRAGRSEICLVEKKVECLVSRSALKTQMACWRALKRADCLGTCLVAKKVGYLESY